MSKQISSDELIPVLTHKKGDCRSFLKFNGTTIATTGILLSGCQEVFEVLPNQRKGAKGMA